MASYAKPPYSTINAALVYYIIDIQNKLSKVRVLGDSSPCKQGSGEQFRVRISRGLLVDQLIADRESVETQLKMQSPIK